MGGVCLKTPKVIEPDFRALKNNKAQNKIESNYNYLDNNSGMGESSMLGSYDLYNDKYLQIEKLFQY